MNRSPENLWDSVLAELLPPDAAARSLAATLREVTRQQRRRRTYRRLAAAVPVLLLGAWIAVRGPQPTSPTPVAYQLPRSDSVLMLATRPLPASKIVSTGKTTNRVKVVETAAGTTTTVHSDPLGTTWLTTAGENGRAQLLDDEGLLTLLAGRSAALVGLGSGTRIVLADTGERTGGL